MELSHPLLKPVPDLWKAPIESWEFQLRASGYTARTIETRLRHIRRIARGLRVPDPRAVSSDQLLTWCGTQQWMAETRHAHYTSLRLFFKHLYGAEDNPAKILPTVRRAGGIPHPTPEDVLVEALDIADDRTELILLLAAQCGLRAFEIAKVHRNDLTYDLLGMCLTVRGKGGKERSIPVEDLWLGNRILAVSTMNGGFLFPGKIDGHLSPRWVSVLASQVLPAPWTLHTLRHRFATRSFNNGGKDIIAVQEVLGHASLATTRRYTMTNNEARRSAVRGALIRL